MDLIYLGLLRYGRPAPDYSRTDATNVVLRFLNTVANLTFLRLILEEEKRLSRPMPLDDLIALSELHHAKRLTVSSLATAVQKNESAARTILEHLVEAGLVDGHGSSRQRDFTLGSAIYRKMGKAGDYVRQAGYDPIQQEQMVLQYALKYGRITRQQASELCHLHLDKASKLLRHLAERKRLVLHGQKRGAYYTPFETNECAGA